VISYDRFVLHFNKRKLFFEVFLPFLYFKWKLNFYRFFLAVLAIIVGERNIIFGLLCKQTWDVLRVISSFH
jgi:hypothetical protein